MKGHCKFLFMVKILLLYQTLSLKVRSLSIQVDKGNTSMYNSYFMKISKKLKSVQNVLKILKKSLAVLCITVITAGLSIYHFKMY